MTNKKVTHKTTYIDQVAFLMHSSFDTAMRKTVMIRYCCVLKKKDKKVIGATSSYSLEL